MNINGTIKEGLAALILQAHKNLLAIAKNCECPRTRALIKSEINGLEIKSRKFRAAHIKYEHGRNDIALDILETANPDHVDQENVDCIIANHEDLT